MNWIDFTIILWCFYYIFLGFSKGFFAILSHFIAFLASFALAVRFHAAVGGFVIDKLGLPGFFEDIIGYIVVAFIAEYVISMLLHAALLTVPKKILASRINKWLGAILSLGSALVMICFVLLVISALPLRGTIKNDIQQSYIGSRLLVFSNTFSPQVQSSIESASKQAVQFLTVKPSSNERINLEFPSASITFHTDSLSEEQMLALVNQERVSLGLHALTEDLKLREVARAKSNDMFMRNYFSHYDPDGKNAADKLKESQITFGVVGENLAYAPDVTIAHKGLMQSKGHRENIVEPSYTKVGIGIIDAGVYGKMFTQVFTD